MRLRRNALAQPGAVHPDRELPLGRDPRVQLPQRAGRGVPGIRGDLLAGGRGLLVHPGEHREREVDLAAHLEQSRRLAAQGQRDRPHRAQVRRHILSTPAVAARGAAAEDTVLVHERDGGAVDLGLDHIGHRLIRVEPLADVVGPLQQRVGGRHLLERAHRCDVLDLAEAVRRRPPDPARRRVVARELRMLLLQGLQLVVEPVVLGVGDLRVVEDVVPVVVMVDELTQLGDAGLHGRLRARQRAPPRW